MFSSAHPRYAYGSEGDVKVKALEPMPVLVTQPTVMLVIKSDITSCPADGYLSNCRVSLLLDQCQIIVLGDRGT